MSNEAIENAIIQIPLTTDLVAALDQIGADSWEPWAILGVDQASQTIRIAVSREKRKITLSSDVKSALIQSGG